MVTHIGDGCRAAGFLPIAMPPSLRHSVDSGRLRSIDFCHRLLSDTSGGELRRPMAGPAPAGPSGAPRLTAGAVPDADMIRAAADALGVDIVNLRRRRAGGQS